MQDRFKFKHWDKQINKMRYGDIQLGNDGKPFVIVDSIENPIEDIEDVITLQCTGLKDKNGKLIYEGDILFEDWKNEVSPKGKYWIVKWNKNQANFYIDIINPSKNITFNQWHLARHDLDYEVIGNIYENPELLAKDGE